MTIVGKAEYWRSRAGAAVSGCELGGVPPMAGQSTQSDDRSIFRYRPPMIGQIGDTGLRLQFVRVSVEHTVYAVLQDGVREWQWPVAKRGKGALEVVWWAPFVVGDDDRSSGCRWRTTGGRGYAAGGRRASVALRGAAPDRVVAFLVYSRGNPFVSLFMLRCQRAALPMDCGSAARSHGAGGRRARCAWQRDGS